MSRLDIAAGLLAGIVLCASTSYIYGQGGKKTEPFQIVEATVDDIHNAMKDGELTSHELVQQYLDRIGAYDKRGPNINAIITLNSQALVEADRLDAAYKKSGFVGALHGIPI